MQLVVTQMGQASVAVPVRYDPPEVMGVSPSEIDAATGGQISITGRNFGDPSVRLPGAATLHTVTVGNATCATLAWVSDGLLQCGLQAAFRVGPLHVVVAVEGQASAAAGAGGAAPQGLLTASCPPGTFGSPGDVCQLCPLGARCLGGLSDPVAVVSRGPGRPSALSLDVEMRVAAHAPRVTVCVVVVPLSAPNARLFVGCPAPPFRPRCARRATSPRPARSSRSASRCGRAAAA
jgi:hypothetical protein